MKQRTFLPENPKPAEIRDACLGAIKVEYARKLYGQPQREIEVVGPNIKIIFEADADLKAAAERINKKYATKTPVHKKIPLEMKRHLKGVDITTEAEPGYGWRSKQIIVQRTFTTRGGKRVTFDPRITYTCPTVAEAMAAGLVEKREERG